ncbi:MAG: DUF5665 domain-containing protein [Patescibacteria group bacterium]
MPKDETANLKKEIAQLNTTLKRVNNFGATFLKGIVAGVGTAIGATIVAAIVVTTIVKVIQSTGVNKFLPESLIISPTNSQE